MKVWKRSPGHRASRGWIACSECGKQCRTTHEITRTDSIGGLQVFTLNECLLLCFRCAERIWPTLQAVNDLSELQ